MRIRFYHWLPALLVATLLHASLVLSFYSPIEGAVASGVGGLEINFGHAEGIANEVSPVDAKLTEPDEPVASIEEVTKIEPIESKAPDEVMKPEPVPTLKTIETAEVKPAKPRSLETQTTKADKSERKSERVAAVAPRQDVHPPREVIPPMPTSAKSIPSKQKPGTANTAGGDKPANKRSYYAELAAWLNKHKRYPHRAQQRRQQGVVKVTFTIDRNGRVLDYRIIDSSGHRLLDQEVAQMLKRASPLPAIPVELPQAQLSITVPIAFSLR